MTMSEKDADALEGAILVLQAFVRPDGLAATITRLDCALGDADASDPNKLLRAWAEVLICTVANVSEGVAKQLAPDDEASRAKLTPSIARDIGREFMRLHMVQLGIYEGALPGEYLSPEQWKLRSVDELVFDKFARVRALNAFDNANIKTIGELTDLAMIDLFVLKHVGRRTIRSIEKALAAIGLSLATTSKKYGRRP